MVETRVEVRFAALLAAASTVLKAHGYRKRGKRFRLDKVGNVSLIDFQRSTTSSAQALRFTINLGIVSGALLDGRDPERDIGKVDITDAHLRDRIGALLPAPADQWWTLTSHTDPDLIEAEVIELLLAAVRYLADHHSDSALLALWRSGRSPGLTETQRLRNLAQLESAAP